MKDQLLDRISNHLNEQYDEETAKILMDEFVRDSIMDIQNESLIKTFLESDEKQFSWMVNDILEPVFLESDSDDDGSDDYGDFVSKVEEEGGFLEFVENEIFVIDNVEEDSNRNYNSFTEAKNGQASKTALKKKTRKAAKKRKKDNSGIRNTIRKRIRRKKKQQKMNI